MRPTFVGIGAQKCASTWLYDILADHPEVVVSNRNKEVDFFSKHFDYGYQWYESHFTERRKALAVGEISPSYFTEADVPTRISAYMPEAKILLSLRHPIERAISHHKHEVREGHYVGPDFSFEAGMRNNPMYVHQGMYATHLSRWLKTFPRERVHIILMEDIKADADAVAAGVYEFIGVSTAHVSQSLYQKKNASYAVRSLAMERLVRASREAVTRAGGRQVWDALGATGLKTLYNKGNRLAPEQIIPAPQPETVALLKQAYACDIDQLEVLLGRKLAQWRRWEEPRLP